MADKKYVNKTLYTEKFYRKISKFNNVKGSGYLIMMVFVATALFLGYQGMQKEERYLLGLIDFCLGLAIIPIYLWLLPYISAKKNFKEMTTLAQGREPVATTEFSDKIYSKNSLGNANNQIYDNVTEICQFHDLLYIGYKDKKSLYCDISGFKTGEYDKVKELLIAKTGLKIKDETR